MIKSSPSAAEQQPLQNRITIGRVGAAQGIPGEMRIIPLTDFPARFKDMREVMVGDELLHIESCRYHKQFVLLKFQEYPVREQAMALTGRLLTVTREEAAPLAAGEFYTFDIIGLAVFDMEGNVLGTITEVLRTGANDVYQVRAEDGRELVIPALKSVVKEINLEQRRMFVDMPGELIDAH